MADIIVDVSLPNPITTDVVSPTQDLNANIYVPGPQGPAGPQGVIGPSGARGAPNIVNSLSGENITITGADGNIVYTTGLNTIFISGNSGYFQSAVNSLTTNLNLTGANLNTSILSLSGLFTGYTGNLDNNYATDAQLQSTGSNLYTLLTNFSGDLDATYATDLQLFNTGNTLDQKINSLSGYSASYINLGSTGSTLDIKINNLSGNLTANYATIINLASTGNTLDTKINSLSGSSASAINLANTGSTLDSKINSLSGSSASISNLFTTGSTLDSKINALSGYSASAVNLASTGSNLYTLITNFSGNLDTDFASQAELNSLSGYVNSQDTSISNNLTSTGSTLDSKINSLSGYSASAVNLTSTGITLINNLFNTGSNLNTKIDNLSGYVNTQDASISNNLNTTGSTLDLKINSLSGWSASAANLASTGSNLTNSIISLSGLFTGFTGALDAIFATDLQLYNTGSTLDNKINSLSGSSVLLYGDQSIGGVKTFRDNVYINNLFVTGTETIVSTNNFNVQSPYILLNLTGGAVDGGIFFVTGAGLTGINNSGPIIGFDHSNKFKFGVSTRNSDLSTLPDIASVQDITTYSGFVDGTYSTIINLASTGSTLSTNLASTGSTLQTNINNLSNTYATITNLASTGSTLVTNLASTGSTLDTKINTLSGYVTGTNSTFTTNLASTGSTLNTRINNLSGYINSSASNIVFTTGNQTISGVKSFAQDTVFGDSAQGDFLVISGNQFTIYGSGNFTSGLFVNGSPVLTGSSTLYATTVNLASTGSTLDTKINNLSGVSVLRFGDQTISGIKTFIGNHNISGNLNVTGNSSIRGSLDVTGLVVSGLGTPFILKSPNNQNSVFFEPTQNGNAGALFSNYVYSSNIGSRGDDNFDFYYGGGGTRSVRFIGGGATNRVLLDSNGNFGIGSGISSVPSRFYVSGDSILQGNLTVSGNVNISGNYDIYSQIENSKKLAIAYAIAL